MWSVFPNCGHMLDLVSYLLLVSIYGTIFAFSTYHSPVWWWCWQTSTGHFISRCHGWWHCNSGLFRILLLTNGCWMNQSRSLSWLSKLVPNEASTRGCCVTNHTPLAGFPHTMHSTSPKTTWKWMSLGNGQHWKSRVVMMPTLLLLVALQLVTESHHIANFAVTGATGDDKVGSVT